MSSGVSRALALHDVTFLELWEAMMAIEPAAAEYAAARRSAPQLHDLTRASARFKREADDTDAAVAAVVDFFTAVAAASGNQVLALSQAPLNLLLAPALTRMIDRVPQARSRITRGAKQNHRGDQAQEERAGAHLDGEAHPRFQARPRVWNCSRAGGEMRP